MERYEPQQLKLKGLHFAGKLLRKRNEELGPTQPHRAAL